MLKLRAINYFIVTARNFIYHVSRMTRIKGEYGKGLKVQLNFHLLQ